MFTGFLNKVYAAEERVKGNEKRTGRGDKGYRGKSGEAVSRSEGREVGWQASLDALTLFV